MLPSIEARIALELSARAEQVQAAVALIDEGSTVPFIARYRKEATGGLDDTQLRTLSERLIVLRDNRAAWAPDPAAGGANSRSAARRCSRASRSRAS